MNDARVHRTSRRNRPSGGASPQEARIRYRGRSAAATRPQAVPPQHPGAAQRPRARLDRGGRRAGRAHHRRTTGLLGHVAAPARPPAGRHRLGDHRVVRPLRRHPAAPSGAGRSRSARRPPVRPRGGHGARPGGDHRELAGCRHRRGHDHRPGRPDGRGRHLGAVPARRGAAPGGPGDPLRRRPDAPRARRSLRLPHQLGRGPRIDAPVRRLLRGPHDHHGPGLRRHHRARHAHRVVAHHAAHQDGAGGAALDHPRPASPGVRHRARCGQWAVLAPGRAWHDRLSRRGLRRHRARVQDRSASAAHVLRHRLGRRRGHLVPHRRGADRHGHRRLGARRRRGRGAGGLRSRGHPRRARAPGCGLRPAGARRCPELPQSCHARGRTCGHARHQRHHGPGGRLPGGRRQRLPGPGAAHRPSLGGARERGRHGGRHRRLRPDRNGAERAGSRGPCPREETRSRRYDPW